MVGVGFILMLLIVLVGCCVYVYVDNKASEPDPTKSDEYRKLEEILGSVKQLSAIYQDDNPILSDVILSEIAKHENRKELK